MSGSEAAPTPEQPKHAPEEYAAVARDLYNHSARIATITEQQGFSEPRKILEFFKSNFRMRQPMPDGAVDIISPPGQDKLPITFTLCFSDDRIPGVGDAVLQKEDDQGGKEISLGGFYDPGSQTIVIPNVDTEPKFELLKTFFHEAGHAWRDLDPKAPKDAPGEKEANSWLFDLRLQEIIGGAYWEKAVAEEGVKIDAIYKNMKLNEETGFAASNVVYEELNSAFGRTRDPKILQYRSMQVAVAANIQRMMTNMGVTKEQAAKSKIVAYHKYVESLLSDPRKKVWND